MEHDIWAEKYRPKTLKDCILPARIRDELEGYLNRNQIPHILFTGSAGTGKTTVAIAFVNDLDAEMFKSNASLDVGIDTLRTDIQNFASSVSFNGKKKVVLLDEFENLSQQTQLALRAFIQEYAAVTSFFGTANYPSKLLPELHSRVTTIDFNLKTKEEKHSVASQYFIRIREILTAEGVKFDEKAVADVVNFHFPDMRAMLVKVQKLYNTYGEISVDSLAVEDGAGRLPELVKLMKEKDFQAIRKWVGENSDLQYHLLYRAFYDYAYTYVQPKTVPAMVVVLAKYLDQHSRSADHEITMASCIAELMVTVGWL